MLQLNLMLIISLILCVLLKNNIKKNLFSILQQEQARSEEGRLRILLPRRPLD
jgi:hypothetical protein